MTLTPLQKEDPNQSKFLSPWYDWQTCTLKQIICKLDTKWCLTNLEELHFAWKKAKRCYSVKKQNKTKKTKKPYINSSQNRNNIGESYKWSSLWQWTLLHVSPAKPQCSADFFPPICMQILKLMSTWKWDVRHQMRQKSAMAWSGRLDSEKYMNDVFSLESLLNSSSHIKEPCNIVSFASLMNN